MLFVVLLEAMVVLEGVATLEAAVVEGLTALVQLPEAKAAMPVSNILSKEVCKFIREKKTVPVAGALLLRAKIRLLVSV